MRRDAPLGAAHRLGVQRWVVVVGERATQVAVRVVEIVLVQVEAQRQRTTQTLRDDDTFHHVRLDEFLKARQEPRIGPVAGADKRIVALHLTWQVLARQDENLLLIGIAVRIGLRIRAADRHPALSPRMTAIVELRFLRARKLEEYMTPGMREIELSLGYAVVGKIEKARIETGGAQRKRDAPAFIEAAVLRVGREINDRQRLRGASPRRQSLAARAIVEVGVTPDLGFLDRLHH